MKKIVGDVRRRCAVLEPISEAWVHEITRQERRDSITDGEQVRWRYALQKVQIFEFREQIRVSTAEKQMST